MHVTYVGRTEKLGHSGKWSEILQLSSTFESEPSVSALTRAGGLLGMLSMRVPQHEQGMRLSVLHCAVVVRKVKMKYLTI